MKTLRNMKYTDTVKISRKDWEAIQASFFVDLREDGDLYDEEVIRENNLKAGTNPLSFKFKFADKTEIYLGWYVEEFGGVVEWGDNEYNTLGSEAELDIRTEFIDEETTNVYVCEFEIVD